MINMNLVLYFFEIIFIILFCSYLFIGTLINNHSNFYSSKVTMPLSSIFISNVIYLYLMLIDLKNIFVDSSIIDENCVYLVNNTTTIFKLLFLLFLVIIFFLLSSYILLDNLSLEYFLTILLSSLGSLILLSANDFFLIYLAIELQTFAFFILIVLDAKTAAVVEAGLKYFILSAIASGFYLIGVLSIYYNTGLTNLQSVYTYLLYNNYFGSEFKTLSIGFLFILATFLFKLALVPFHNWVIDVYEGASLPTLTFLSILPKISVFFVFFKIYQLCIFELPAISYVLILVVNLSVLIGSLGAISEYKIQRILAYSGLINSSFLVMGICIPFYEGYQSAFLFLCVYFLSVLGFLGHIYVLRTNVSITQIEYLSSVCFVNPVYGINLSIYFFALAGLPPFLSFYTKFYLMYILSWWFNIVIVCFIFLINLIAFYFYIRFIRLLLFFDSNKEYYYSFYFPISRTSSYVLVFVTYLQIFYMYYFSLLFNSSYLFFLAI